MSKGPHILLNIFRALRHLPTIYSVKKNDTGSAPQKAQDNLKYITRAFLSIYFRIFKSLD
jgi:hypothetical protein